MHYQWFHLCLRQGVVNTVVKCLEPWPGEREEVPKDVQRRVPHHAVQLKGSLSQNGTASEADGLNQPLWKATNTLKTAGNKQFAG